MKFLIFLPLLSAKFLHITDIHLDPHYKIGSSLGSSCHQVMTTLNGNSAGTYGAPGSGCDSPEILVNKTFEFIQTIVHDLDFVIWTGDNARHDSDPSLPRPWEEILDLNSQLTLAFKKVFKGKIVLPSIGNNDVYPHNTLAFDPQGDNQILNSFARLWEEWIPVEQVQGFRIHGCFSVDLGKDLRGISLNTLYLFNSNPYSDDCKKTTSPGYLVLAWLENALEKAQKEEKGVYISGHVPPNSGNFVSSCYQRFTEICQKYTRVINGQFYGHMNLDHFFFPVQDTIQLSKPKSVIPSWISVYFQSLLFHYKMFHKRKYDCITPILVAPSVVPAFNPAIRIYDYSEYGLLSGYEQYFANLSFWNSGDSNSSFFTLLYTPRDAYGMSRLHGCDYKHFAKKLIKSTRNPVLVDASRGEKKRESDIVKRYLWNMLVGMQYL